LNEVRKWHDNNNIDHRYAEEQKSQTAFRYRDWLTLYQDRTQIKQAKLQVFAVRVQNLFHITLPWIRKANHTNDNDIVTPVHIVSTYELKFWVLKGSDLHAIMVHYFKNKPWINPSSTQTYTWNWNHIGLFYSTKENPKTCQMVMLMT